LFELEFDISTSEHIVARVSKTGSGLYYKPQFITPKERKEILDYLSALHPLWEKRYSKHNPPPAGKTQRELLRPVYWLGNWQFACLGYYHPPKGLHHRSVRAEEYPEPIAQMVSRIENFVHDNFAEKDIPRGWHLNTCLVNFYGSKSENGKEIDAARVGEHKDFEPGPIGSVSFGEKALFQFVASAHREAQSRVITQQWLEDSSLQVFGGDKFKKQLFHRVQRVESKKSSFSLATKNFTTRRLNLTFRYVPDEHVAPLQRLPRTAQEDIAVYVQELAQYSEFWKQEFAKTLAAAPPSGTN
jgi:alkylated DNA repair protein (DNA oxidative demethylase)